MVCSLAVFVLLSVGRGALIPGVELLLALFGPPLGASVREVVSFLAAPVVPPRSVHRLEVFRVDGRCFVLSRLACEAGSFLTVLVGAKFRPALEVLALDVVSFLVTPVVPLRPWLGAKVLVVL